MDNSIATGIVTAGAALLGVLLSQLTALVTSRRDKHHQREILMRTKYEELAEHLNKSLIRMDMAMEATNRDAFIEVAQPHDARSVYMLTLLYFPKVTNAAAGYLTACLALSTAISGRETGFAINPGWDRSLNVEGILQASRIFKDKRTALDTMIAKCAPLYVMA